MMMTTIQQYGQPQRARAFFNSTAMKGPWTLWVFCFLQTDAIYIVNLFWWIWRWIIFLHCLVQNPLILTNVQGSPYFKVWSNSCFFITNSLFISTNFPGGIVYYQDLPRGGWSDLLQGNLLFLQGINTPLIDSRLTIWNLGQQAPEKLLAEVSDTAYPPEMMTPYMNNMNIEQHLNKS